MYFEGILIGAFTFFIIGIFRPVVIKAEYYFTSRIWPVFLLVGVICLLLALRAGNVVVSSALGILGFTCFWGISELKVQADRVENGWYPKNPRRNRRRRRTS